MARVRKNEVDDSIDEAAASGSNSADVKAIIKSAADRIARLNEEIAGLRAEVTEVKGEVRGAGIKMADFNAALRLYNLDAEDRNESLDNIRMCFAALGIGSQGDLFPAGATASDGAGHPLH